MEDKQIWLATFHFIKRHKVTTGKQVKTVVEELISGEFVLSNTPDKCKDSLHIQSALRTRGIEKSDKTAYAKWTADDVKVSCKLIKQIYGLSTLNHEN